MNIDQLVRIVGSRLTSVEDVQRIGEKWFNFFVSHNMIKPGMRILDYGAGLGRLAIPFNKIAKVVALDVNPDMVAYLKEHGVEAYLATDCNAVQGPFDFAISCYVFEHNSVEDCQTLVKQICKLTDIFYFTYPTVEAFDSKFPPGYAYYKQIEKLPLLVNTQTSRMMYYRELPLLLKGSTFDPNSLYWVKDIGANLFRVINRKI